MAEKLEIEPVAHIRTDFPSKFGIPRQSGVVPTLRGQIVFCPKYRNADALRGLEGEASARYFSVFDHLILNQKNDFSFDGRNRHPPRDNVNALLSFAYTLLANDCGAALESVGLDSYVGFMHRDKPGRASLALDLMEELRPCIADRFVLKLINNRVLQADCRAAN